MSGHGRPALPRDVLLGVVRAGLDLLSLVGDGMTRPGGPSTAVEALDAGLDALAAVEQLLPDSSPPAGGPTGT